MDKIAAVTCIRNNGYKDINKVALSITSFIEEFDEVWLIDWNSPIDPIFAELYDKIPHLKKLRCVVISPSLAGQLLEVYPDAHPCCEPIARNIGIRRCEADWIVNTSVDII